MGNLVIATHKELTEMITSLRAENEKLRASLKQFMAAYYEQMRKQGWSDLDVVNNDDYRAAAAALKETGDE